MHRWSQIFLMCLVFVCYVYITVRVVISYKPSNHVLVSKKCGPEIQQFTVDLSNSTELEDGSLKNGDLVYPSRAQWNHNNFTRGCPCLFKTCITKCCPTNQRFVSSTNLTCIDDTSVKTFESFLKVYDKLGNLELMRNLGQKVINKSDFFIFSQNNCDEIKGRFGSRVQVIDGNTFLMEDGTTLTSDMMYIDLTDYCMESVQGSNKTITVSCVEKKLMEGVRFYIISFTTVLSIMSLLATITVYAYLPQMQNLHGKMVMCYLCSLIVFYISFFITGLVHQNIVLNTAQYFMQFALFGCFTWLTIMSFDIWSVFSRRLKPQGPNKQTQHHRLLVYSVFGWGCPIVLCVLTAAVGVVPRVSDSCEKPRFKDDSCFFTLQRTRTLFSTLPLMLFIILNLVMFLSTLYNMKFHFKQSETFSKPNSRRHRDSSREGVSLYTKLALVMGVNWIITFAYKMNISILKLIVVTLESSQGIILLLVLVCNKRVLGFIKKQWYIMNGEKRITLSTSNNTSSSDR